MIRHRVLFHVSVTEPPGVSTCCPHRCLQVTFLAAPLAFAVGVGPAAELASLFPRHIIQARDLEQGQRGGSSGKKGKNKPFQLCKMRVVFRFRLLFMASSLHHIIISLQLCSRANAIYSVSIPARLCWCGFIAFSMSVVNDSAIICKLH